MSKPLHAGTPFHIFNAFVQPKQAIKAMLRGFVVKWK